MRAAVARGVVARAARARRATREPARDARRATRGTAARARRDERANASAADAVAVDGTVDDDARAVDRAEAAARAVKTPHSGYHRQRGVARAFFEGWYFRFTLPSAKASASLIYHVYDPDLPESARGGAGAQVCAPCGKYLYFEQGAEEARAGFEGAAHALELKSTRGDDFFEVSREGARHRGSVDERGRERGRAVGRRTRGEERAMGHHGDAASRMGGRTGGEDGVARGLDDGAAGVRAALASHHGARIGERMDRDRRRAR